MDRRRLVVTTGSVALMLAASTTWAGPPPPPPSGGGGGGDVPAVSGPNDGPTFRGSAPPAPNEFGGGGPPADPLVIDQRTPDTDLTGVWGYSRGRERTPNYVRSADEDPYFVVNPVGYYQGVTVGSGNLPPFAPREVGGSSAVLTWTGFDRAAGRSRVFFQLSAAIEPEVEVDGLTVRVKLPQTAIKVRNNRRKLITKYFKTPVTEVRIRRKGRDVFAEVALRWEAEPSWRVEPGNNGYQMLVLEFADHEDDDTATPPPPGPPAKSQPSSPPANGGDEGGPFLPTD